jgi:hypothetical protein
LLIFAPFTIRTGIFAAGAAAAFAILPWLTPRFFKMFGNRPSELEAKFLLLILFGFGALASWADSEAVLPAYIVSAARRDSAVTSALDLGQRIDAPDAYYPPLRGAAYAPHRTREKGYARRFSGISVLRIGRTPKCKIDDVLAVRGRRRSAKPRGRPDGR